MYSIRKFPAWLSWLKGRLAGSNHAPALLVISLVEFYKCIFGANVIDFEMFKNVVEIVF